jgi:uncharacterized membrane protein
MLALATPPDDNAVREGRMADEAEEPEGKQESASGEKQESASGEKQESQSQEDGGREESKRPQPPQQRGSGISKKNAGIIAYALGWITGVAMMFAGKDDPDTRYNGAQSVVIFGGLTVLLVICEIFFNFPVLKIIFGLIYYADLVAGLILWIMCLVLVSRNEGRRFQVPVIGQFVEPLADRLAGSVA